MMAVCSPIRPATSCTEHHLAYFQIELTGQVLRSLEPRAGHRRHGSPTAGENLTLADHPGDDHITLRCPERGHKKGTIDVPTF
jgi:hypothetical protein